MSFDDLIWKIWEIEEEIRKKEFEAEALKQNLRELKTDDSGTIIKPSSPHIGHSRGVKSYCLKFQNDSFEFTANDLEKRPVMRVYWKKQTPSNSIDSALPNANPNINIMLEKASSHEKLEIKCDSFQNSVLLNGSKLSFNELENPDTAALMYEYRTYFQDFLIKLTKDMQEKILKGSGNGGVSNDKKAIDIISDISCVCASFGWLGLAICGPTCLGMVIAKAVDP